MSGLVLCYERLIVGGSAAERWEGYPPPASAGWPIKGRPTGQTRGGETRGGETRGGETRGASYRYVRPPSPAVVLTGLAWPVGLSYDRDRCHMIATGVI